MNTPTRMPTPELTQEDVRDRIIWENKHLVIWDKPSGLPVHPGFGGGITLHDYMPLLRFHFADRVPGLLHRLDRETSGCLALGRTDEALSFYGKIFQQHRVGKKYLAIVYGRPPQDEGTIDLPILQERIGAGMRSKVDKIRGQEARTHYRVLKTNSGLSLIEAQPKTGRMHQIRVHMQAIGCPIAGDRLYGGNTTEWARLMLHAAELSLPASSVTPAIEAQSPYPEEWKPWLS